MMKTLKKMLLTSNFLIAKTLQTQIHFLASLKQVKKLRITSVEWDLEECNWYDYYEDISNTIH